MFKKLKFYESLKNLNAAVVVVSDRCSKNPQMDTSGENLVELLKDGGFKTIEKHIVPDEIVDISTILKTLSSTKSFILTTGGTGFAPRDITPEATLQILTRLAPGIPEAMRMASMQITDRACLSRGVAGMRNSCLIINLPGSKKAAEENLLSIFDPIVHGIELLNNGSADCAGHYNT